MDKNLTSIQTKQIIIYSMNKIIFCLSVAILSIAIFSSCSHYKSIQHAEKMVDLARNPFLKNLSKSVFNDIAHLDGNINENSVSNIKLTSVLSSVIPSNSMESFKNLISTKYNIPLNKIEGNIASWKYVRDVIGFIAKFGSGFHFYRS